MMMELFCSGPNNIFAKSNADHEQRIDRALNIKGSRFQHEKFFSDLEKLIIDIFMNEDVDDDPDVIVDMGCGNGTLLKRVYSAIIHKTTRGKLLETNHVTLIGVDFNDKVLEEASHTLQSLPHILMHGDIN